MAGEESFPSRIQDARFCSGGNRGGRDLPGNEDALRSSFRVPCSGAPCRDAKTVARDFGMKHYPPQSAESMAEYTHVL